MKLTDTRKAGFYDAFSSPSIITLLGLLFVWAELLNQLRLYWSVDPTYSYGWLVPFLALYLFIKRWPSRPERGSPSGYQWLVAAGALLFAPVRLIQEATPDWSVVNWALACSVLLISFGILGKSGGIPWMRHFAFPVCFILVAVPWPNRFEQNIVNGLMHQVAGLTGEILNWFGIVAWRRGNLIELPNGTIGVDEACSGVRSLQAMLMVSLFLGELYRLTAQARLICVVAGLSLALIFNIIRTFSLSLLAANRGLSEVPKWHDPAGFAILIASLATLWLLVNHFRPPSLKIEVPAKMPGSFRPLPVVTGICLMAWLLFAEAGTQAWYYLHEKNLPPRTRWSIRWPENAQGYKLLSIPENTTKILLANEWRAASWYADGNGWLLYSFKWNPGRTSTQSARMHRPDTCLQASGAVMQADLGLRRFSVGGLEFPFRAYVFKRGDATMYVFFCIMEDRNRDLNESHLLQDWSGSSRLQRVLTGQRNLGQQSLEFAILGPQDQQTADAVFQKELRKIIEFPEASR